MHEMVKIGPKWLMSLEEEDLLIRTSMTLSGARDFASEWLAKAAKESWRKEACTVMITAWPKNLEWRDKINERACWHSTKFFVVSQCLGRTAQGHRILGHRLCHDYAVSLRNGRREFTKLS